MPANPTVIPLTVAKTTSIRTTALRMDTFDTIGDPPIPLIQWPGTAHTDDKGSAASGSSAIRVR